MSDIGHQASNQAGGGIGAAREKVWPERNADEKLEALRWEVRRLIRHNYELEKKVNDLMRHQHHPKSGNVLAPLDPDGAQFGYRYHEPYPLRDTP